MGGTIIGLDEAWAKMQEGDAVYVDVRSTGEFDGGHAEGAYHVPLIEMGPAGKAFNEGFVAQIRALVGSVGEDKALIIGCQMGGRSRQACQLLDAEGIANTFDFSGGWGGRPHPFGGAGTPGWSGSDLPRSTSAQPGRDWVSIKALVD